MRNSLKRSRLIFYGVTGRPARELRAAFRQILYLIFDEAVSFYERYHPLSQGRIPDNDRAFNNPVLKLTSYPAGG
jgi:hypothetical protein